MTSCTLTVASDPSLRKARSKVRRGSHGGDGARNGEGGSGVLSWSEKWTY